MGPVMRLRDKRQREKSEMNTKELSVKKSPFTRNLDIHVRPFVIKTPNHFSGQRKTYGLATR